MIIGVIGAGTMGSGIAKAFAAHKDYQIILGDISEELAQKGRQRIAAAFNKAAAKGKLTEDEAQAAISRIKTGALTDLAPCELIIEAATENMDVKRELFGTLTKICPASTIFATNTSSLSITEIGLGIEQQVIGMHFFNPADIMKLVEVIAGMHTRPQTIAKIKDIAASIVKTPVEVQESPGFVVNRLLIPMINEGAAILAEGAATAEDIDTAMKLGANHPLGPLALGDLIGLDVCLAIMDVLYQESGDSKHKAHPLLRKMVRGGLLGRKTGRGFFDYSTH